MDWGDPPAVVLRVAELAPVHQPQEGVHHVAGQLGAGDLPDDGDGPFEVHALAIGAVGVHGVKAIRHRDDMGHPGISPPFRPLG